MCPRSLFSLKGREETFTKKWNASNQNRLFERFCRAGRFGNDAGWFACGQEKSAVQAPPTR